MYWAIIPCFDILDVVESCVDQCIRSWQNAIYTVDNPDATTLHTSQNKGREATPYLTYVIDNYSDLPEIIVFLHPHATKAWHIDNEGKSNIQSVQDLQLQHVKKQGYVNLRCAPLPVCGGEVELFRKPPLGEHYVEKDMPDAWRQMFGAADLPSRIGVACCAQFAVSRERVLQRSKEDYERYRQWVWETTLPDARSGRVMEFLWHIIFGQNAVQWV